MEQMVKKLYEAAVEGNTTTLLHLLHQDPLILDRCVVTSYEETPLHVAAMRGHLEFCSELVKREPELAGELDNRRSSALHLASAKGHIEIVKILLSKKDEICLAHDEDGCNPIHVAAMKGRVDVLKTLVEKRPDAARAKVKIHQGENVLHLCVQYHQPEALMCLVEAMSSDQEFVNTKDDNGNSILHLAMVDKQVEIIEYLVSKTHIDINAKNSSGLTPLDILAQTKRDSKYLDILQCLQHSKGWKSQSNVEVGRHQRQKKPWLSILSELFGSFEKRSDWLEKQQTAVMLVATIIATMGFQANFAPPGGYWQDTKPAENDQRAHTAGVSILSDQDPETYVEFVISNTIGFMTSLSVILLLISGLPFKHEIFTWLLMLVMWVSISATAYTFSISMANNSKVDKILTNTVIIWTLVMALVIVVNTVRFIDSTMTKWHRKFKILAWTMVVIVWGFVAFILLRIADLLDPSLVKDYVLTVGAVVGIGYVSMVVLLGLLQLVVILVSYVDKKIKRPIRGYYRSSNPPVITQV